MHPSLISLTLYPKNNNEIKTSCSMLLSGQRLSPCGNVLIYVHIHIIPYDPPCQPKKNRISPKLCPLFPDALIPVIETIFAVGAIAKRLVSGFAATAQGDPVPGLIAGTGG